MPNSRGGLFSFDPPNGTCYLAVDEETALRERLGPTNRVVSYGWADETTGLRPSRFSEADGSLTLATSCRSQFGMTREVAT
jgi:hypothetical protein